MRYRRLGQTELMVSELGLEVRATLAAGEEQAEATLRAAIDAGVTVFAWDVSDATEDVEPLVIRAAGVDRGRLSLLAVLDALPPADEIGPQAEAIASRLSDPEGSGYVDILGVPAVPDAAQAAALDEVRRRGIARFIALVGRDDSGWPKPPGAGIDVAVLSGAPSSDAGGIGVIARARVRDVPALVEGGHVQSTVTGVADASELARLLLPVD